MRTAEHYADNSADDEDGHGEDDDHNRCSFRAQAPPLGMRITGSWFRSVGHCPETVEAGAVPSVVGRTEADVSGAELVFQGTVSGPVIGVVVLGGALVNYCAVVKLVADIIFFWAISVLADALVSI